MNHIRTNPIMRLDIYTQDKLYRATVIADDTNHGLFEATITENTVAAVANFEDGDVTTITGTELPAMLDSILAQVNRLVKDIPTITTG